MELSVTTFITLDGVYQAPGAPQEDPSGGFTHGGWSAPYGDEAFGAFMVSVFDRVDAFLLGRRTYEIFASYWPEHDDPANPIAHKLNTLPKYVATHSRQSRLVRHGAAARRSRQRGRRTQSAPGP